VPDTFARLVTLDGVTFEYAIALGLSPIATAVNGFLDHMAEQVAQVKHVGLSGEPNLEEVLALKPDMIVGLDFNQASYAQAARIAPTVMLSFDHSGQWKTGFQRFAQALGRPQAAHEVMTAYEIHLADLRERLDASSPLAHTTDWRNMQVSVVRIYPESFSVYLKDSFAGTVLHDVGLARPPAQDIGADEAAALFGNPIQNRISRELIHQADGDVIFLWTGENSDQAAATAKQQLQALQQDPLWRQLKAVQNGHVYNVPSYWIGSGPIAAKAILSDLSTYLVQPS